MSPVTVPSSKALFQQAIVPAEPRVRRQPDGKRKTRREESQFTSGVSPALHHRLNNNENIHSDMKKS